MSQTTLNKSLGLLDLFKGCVDCSWLMCISCTMCLCVKLIQCHETE